MLPGPPEWPVEHDELPETRDVLRQRAAATPERVALVDADGGERLTYAEFDERVTTRRDALARSGVSPERVALLLDTGVTAAETYFAVGRLGAAAVPLNTRLDRGTLANQSAAAAVDLLVAGRDHADTAAAIASPGTPVVTSDGTAVVGGSATRGRPSAESPESAGERLVMFTSGTTGEPKGVRLTRSNLVASAVGSAHRLGVEPGDRWLICLPMYHMGGLAPLVRSTLYGTTAVVQRDFDADGTAAVIDSHDVTGVSLVPTMLDRLLDASWQVPDALRFVLLGGAPAPPSLVERSLDRGVPVYPTYGLTETASQVATATPEDVRDAPDTVGRPLRTADVTVVDGGEPVDVGVTGELVVGGPVVTPGYLDGDRWSAAVGPHGFHTGDLGYRDESGRLWVVGRVDDRIVTGGENVAPERVARAIRRLDGVEDATVVGLPDETWGERVAALVVAEHSLSAESLRERLRGSLADYELPKTVGFAASIPRTASGTVDREAVRERLTGGE